MGNEFPATAKEVELSFQFKALSRPCLYKVSTDVLTWIKFHDLHFTAELNSRGFIQDQAQANYLAVQKIFHTWFDKQEEIFSNEEVQFKEYNPPLKTICPPAKNVDDTPASQDNKKSSCTCRSQIKNTWAVRKCWYKM